MEKSIEPAQPKLTPKQREFLKLYFESGNGTLSAMKAYNVKSYDVASSIASQNLRKLKITIKDYMEAKGISIGTLVKTLQDGLKANRVISAINTDKQASGATADFIEVPDHLVRHRYLETASKWLGVPDKEDTNNTNVKRRVIAEEFFES